MAIINGGPGDDTLIPTATNDVIDGKAGYDVIDYVAIATAITVDLNIVGPQLVTTGKTDVIKRIEGLIGTNFADVLIGDGKANGFIGGKGDDTLKSGIGADSLRGGQGNDYLDGGAGEDTAEFIGAPAVTVDLNNTGVQNTGDGFDTILNVENVVGSSFADTIIGDAVANKLFGGLGADTLFGGAGNDSLHGDGGVDKMLGDVGDDQYWIDVVGDSADETGGVGLDKVWTEISYTAQAGIEQVTSITLVNVTLTGNTLDNTLTGGGGNDQLFGLDGKDVLQAGTGFTSVLYGGSGKDKLFSGPGADVLFGEAGNDTLTGGFEGEYMEGGAGADRYVYLAVSDSYIDPILGDLADLILFVRTDGDSVDLSPLDADINTLPNDAFTFIGAAAFTGSAGELRHGPASPFNTTLNSWAVEADVDGDAVADLTIELLLPVSITSVLATDFVL